MTLPNFLIIGASSAGTTSLYHYLGQHPDVYMSPVKEPRYFTREGEEEWDGDPIRSRESYERLFDGVTDEKAVGEASPQYLNSPGAPERIAAELPGVRLIATLRNPADRAYSSYLGRLSSGIEKRGVVEALQPGTVYFETSLYHPRLSRFIECFDRDRIKVVLFDDLAGQPAAVITELYEFLEVDPKFVTDVKERHNPGQAPRSIPLNNLACRAWRMLRPLVPHSIRQTGAPRRAHQLLLRRPDALPVDIRRRLRDQFRDDIEKTGALIGQDLSHWLA